MKKLIESLKKHGRALLVAMVALSMGLILVGGISYVMKGSSSSE